MNHSVVGKGSNVNDLVVYPSATSLIRLPIRCPEGADWKAEEKKSKEMNIPTVFVSPLENEASIDNEVRKLLSRSGPIGLRIIIPATRKYIPRSIISPLLNQSIKRNSRLGLIAYKEDKDLMGVIITTDEVFKKRGINAFYRISPKSSIIANK